VAQEKAGDRETTRIEPSDWANLRPTVDKYVKCVAEKAGIDAHPIVVGAAGRYAGYEYKATPDQIAAELLAKLWQAIDAKLGGAPEGANIRLHLDLTHGVNYMPVLLLHTAQHLANILLAAGAKSVTIDAYNAPPKTDTTSKSTTKTPHTSTSPKSPTTRPQEPYTTEPSYTSPTYAASPNTPPKPSK